MHALGLSKVDRWSLPLARYGLLGLCLLPFLVYWHAEPIPSFYNEAMAFACGLLVLPLLAALRAESIPRVVLAPGIVLLALALQLLWLPAGLRALALPALLYLLWLVVLICAVGTVRAELSLSRLVPGMAACLALAALANAISLLLYHAGVRSSPAWLFLRPDLRANLAQVNHVADLLWLGVASLLYLVQRPVRYRHIWWLLLPVLLAASVCTGARAPIAYAAALIVLAGLSGNRHRLLASLGVAVLYGVLLFTQHTFFADLAGGRDSLSRLAESAHYGSGGNVRLGLLSMAAGITADHPWLGAGWGSFAWESYQRVVPGMDWQGTAEHAHQLFFQLAAEMGIVPALLLAIVLCGWLRRVLPQLRDAEVRWAVSIAGIVLLHAQVEYPLWYAHFAGICVVALALADPHCLRLPAWRLRVLPLSLLSATAVYLLVMTWAEHDQMAAWLRQDHGRQGQPIAADHFKLLADLHQGSLLESQAVLILAAVMTPDDQLLTAKRSICARALAIQPQTPTVFGCALLDYRAGAVDLGRQRWEQALMVFRSDAPAYLQTLRQTLGASQLTPVETLLSEAERTLAAPVEE